MDAPETLRGWWWTIRAAIPFFSVRRFLRNNLRLLRGLRRVMNHGVGVFHSDTISTGLLFEKAHEVVVVLAFCPVALPFEQRPTGGQPHRARLHHAREGCFLRCG